jgi:hypothetical protein
MKPSPSRRTPHTRPAVPYRSAKSVLAELRDDVAYLELKERLGEHLTPSERFALELHRAAPADPAATEGGGT